MPIATDLDKMFIATALDSEGSLFGCIHKHGKLQKPSIQVYLTFTNNSLKWLELLKDLCGDGKIRRCTNSSAYTLSIEKQDSIKTILKAIFSYLIIKFEQASLMINYLNRKNWYYNSSNYIFLESLSKLNSKRGREE